MKVEWSVDAVADLDRFARFLHDRYPSLAAVIGREIIRGVETLSDHPRRGRPIAEREDYREMVLRVLNADYVFQYRLDPDRIVMLRVFHGREKRD